MAQSVNCDDITRASSEFLGSLSIITIITDFYNELQL